MVACPQCGEQLDDDARFCGMCGAGVTPAMPTTMPAVPVAHGTAVHAAAREVTPAFDPNIGRTIAHYVLRERMGGGSLGAVYRAEQLGSGRRLALKLFHPDRERDPAAVDRFTREAAILTQLRSPHTVTIYDFGTDPSGALYIAMELSPGRSLAGVLAEDGALDWWRVLRILHGLCDSLGEAHALGVVHRDIRPKNVFVEDRASARDFAKLVDFGLAKALAPSVATSPAGQSIDNLEYNSPEQLLHRPIDARSDLYALGVLGFRLVTGYHPFFNARSVGDLVAATINAAPPAASATRPDLPIPPDVDHLLARLLEKDPERRFPDTASLGAICRVALASRLPETGDTMRESDIEVDDELIADEAEA